MLKSVGLPNVHTQVSLFVCINWHISILSYEFVYDWRGVMIVDVRISYVAQRVGFDQIMHH